MTPEQGDVWWAEAEDKRRPVLVVTRSEAVPVLTTILVAPVTRTIRAIPTEVELGPEEGLAVECVASLDNLQPIRRGFLTERAGRLGPDGRLRLCGALRAVADC
ncbi:MAG TPA: type II toxin-antitoxin system PemK/MazF family toxin [Acidimicrobiales bacterium]|nr:type II toxin-antitoxin system PemK/MazF family toxin [Acidimicrobiales bacterium]